MMKIITIILLLIVFWFNAFSQYYFNWQHCYGGSDNETFSSICKTYDNGYMICGKAESTDGDVLPHNNLIDPWFVKIDSAGNIQWQTFGISSEYGVQIRSVAQTSDSGYIYTGSLTFETLYSFQTDVMIGKLDSSGNEEWTRIYGGSDYDEGSLILQTPDGGYIVAAFAMSVDGDVVGHGNTFSDFWILKLDSSGNIVWQKCLGGTGLDVPKDVIITKDSCYVVCGELQDSFFSSAQLYKLDTLGNLIWEKTYGGSGNDYFAKVIQEPGGGFLLAGYTNSFDGDAVGNHGEYDGWVVRLDSAGNFLWQKCYGGSQNEQFYYLSSTLDSGYILTGWATSTDGDVYGLQGSGDFWTVEIDSTGTLLWQLCLGGTSSDHAYFITETSERHFLIGGTTNSDDGQVIANHGTSDYWLVSFVTDSTIYAENYSLLPIKCYPNPSDELVYINLPEKTLLVEVFDINGNLVKSLRPQKQIVEINTQGLPIGLYVVKIQTDKNVVTTKFVKE